MLRVTYTGDGPDHLLGMTRVALGSGPEDPQARDFEVETALPGRPGEVRLGLRGIARREEAEALRGKLVLADAEQIEPLPPGEHYWYELVGCRVETVDGTLLGTVREIWETGAHDVLVIEGEAGRRHLIPAAQPFLERVEVGERRIVIEAIPGLLDPV
jgi:16S rRNA processing protein RimM